MNGFTTSFWIWRTSLTHKKIQNIYSEFVSDGCSEKGSGGADCGIELTPSFSVICAERAGNEIGGIYKNKETCDCIILDPAEEKISLVELKSGTPNIRKIRLLRKAKRQLMGGLEILHEMLRDVEKPQVKLQVILASNERFRSIAAQKEFHKRLEHPINIKLIRIDCGSSLPNRYVNKCFVL